MKKKLTYRVRLKGSNGQVYVETFEELGKDLGIPALKSRIDTLEQPLRQQKILDLLKSEGPRSNNYLSRHLPDYRWTDLWDLINVKKKVVKKYHGTQEMYHLNYPAGDEP